MEFVKQRLPSGALAFLRHIRTAPVLAAGYLYDFSRYWRFASTDTVEKGKLNLRARLTERYHNVEKGLSLPSPRPGFGKDRIPALLDYIDLYVSRFGADAVSDTAISVVARYKQFNLSLGLENYPQAARIDKLLLKQSERGPLPEISGVKSLTQEDIARATKGVGLDFFLSRHSIRQFSSTPVTDGEIEFAVQAATKSPAVCNRQNAKLYVTRQTALVQKLLKIQGGAAGFSENVTAVAVITTNVRSFWGVEERNQGWIDGGLFAMSFLLGLHAQALGAVSLNWSKTPAKDRELRTAIPLEDSEIVIFMVAIGHLREEFSVAQSWRPPVSSILVDLDRAGVIRSTCQT